MDAEPSADQQANPERVKHHMEKRRLPIQPWVIRC